MRLNDKDLLALQELIAETASEAGGLISERMGQVGSVSLKKQTSTLASQVVTEVDKASEALIIKRLSEATERFDLGVLSEEIKDDGSRHQKDYFWCIDPLDGTLAFIQGESGFAVSIALVDRAGKPIVAAVYDPVNGTLYSALAGRGAFRNGQRWSPGLLSEASFSFIFDQSFAQHPRYDVLIQSLEAWVREQGYQQFHACCYGGAVMNALTLLEQGTGVYCKVPKPELGGGSVWDFAATACVYQEVGALARDFSGQPLKLNPSTSTYMNHCGVLYSSNASLQDEARLLCQQALLLD